jgi:spore germination cell wall hydrolase CwlJ-like protein
MKLSKTLLIVFTSLCIPISAKQYEPLIKEQVGADINKQVLCIAKNIYYEAARESHEGKLAVAQVTINRANSKKYPSDFCGVVYQKTGATCQFTWTCENVSPMKDTYAWEECLYIAKRALTESVLHRELAKTKAMFYHAVYVNPGWTNIRVVKKIGNHIFYTKENRAY